MPMRLSQSLEKRFLALHLETSPSVVDDLRYHVEVEIRNAVAAEREMCATLAEAPINGQPHTELMRGKREAANTIARNIRARKTQAI
jgi:hypothetical protein